MYLNINKFLKKVYSRKWLNNALNTSEFKEKPYLSYTEYGSYAELKKLVKIIKLIKDYTNERKFKPNEVNMLDIGCGPGDISLPLAAEGYNLIGVDLNNEVIAEANKRAKRVNINNCSFLTKDILDYLQNIKDKIHIIIAADVLEHLKEPQTLCEAVLKKLVNNGIFILTIPNGYGALELFINTPTRIIRKIFGIKVEAGYDHVQRFTFQGIKRLLVESGFQPVKFIGPIDFFSPFPFLNRSILARLDLKISEVIPKYLANRWIFAGIKGDKDR